MPAIIAAVCGLGATALATSHPKFGFSLLTHLRVSDIALALLFIVPFAIAFRPEAMGSKGTSQAPVKPATVYVEPTKTPHSAGSQPIAVTVITPAPENFTIPWGRGIAIGWLIGLLACSARIVWQLFRLGSLKRKFLPHDTSSLHRIAHAWPAGAHLQPQQVKLRSTDSSTGPFSLRGFLNPHLVIPEQWISDHTDAQLELAIAHELSHLQHHDFWRLIAWRLVAALHWWNPLIWMLRSRAERLTEFRADSDATSGSMEAAHQLSHILLASGCTEDFPATAQAISRSGTRTMSARVRRLLDNDTADHSMTKKQRQLLTALAIGTCGFLASCACMTPAQSTRTAEEVMSGHRDIMRQSEALGDDLSKHAASLRNASDKEEYFSVEVKFFEIAPRAKTTASESPTTEVLTSAETNELVRKCLADRRTTTISYPRVITKSRRTAKIMSVVNQPVFVDRDEAKNSTRVGYIPVGSQIAICPTRLKNGQIDLGIAAMLTTIVGSEKVGEDTHPIVSSLKFSAPITVAEGETVRISNLPAPIETASAHGLTGGKDKKVEILVTVASAPKPKG